MKITTGTAASRAQGSEKPAARATTFLNPPKSSTPKTSGVVRTLNCGVLSRSQRTCQELRHLVGEQPEKDVFYIWIYLWMLWAELRAVPESGRWCSPKWPPGKRTQSRTIEPLPALADAKPSSSQPFQRFVFCRSTPRSIRHTKAQRTPTFLKLYKRPL